MIDLIKNNEKAPRRLGLYIHIPFCRSKCLYCDFCSFVGKREDEREEYVCALLREIEARGTKDYTVDTVYFGGGTPSILSAEQIGRILSSVRENFKVADDVEITLECNPMTRLDDGRDYFSSLRELGVNRLSLGVQSAVDGELKLIGRRHTFDEAEKTFFDARGAGFDNISVDLMFGIPSQTLESLEYSLEQFILLGAEHISIYSLQLEEGTPLFRMRDGYALADDDTVADMYISINEKMRAAGYSHYEISNFAKEGRESRHNSKYWQLEEYLGLGVASHSDFAGKRIENTESLEKYLLGELIENVKVISKAERELEFIMLGLRMSEGISKIEYFERFGADFDEKYGKRIGELKEFFTTTENGDRIALNERGFAVSNAILSQILDFDY